MARLGSSPVRFVRRAFTFGVASVGLLVAVSCSDQHVSYEDCDYVDRSCRTVCDYWCDGWGCYPTCWEQCWDDCYRYADSPTRPDEPPPVSDAASPPPSQDGGASSGGSGSLCSTCTSNADCASGALCILRGGPRPDASTAPGDAGGPPPGAGFCGQACASTTDCPQGFACSQLGSVRQCIPTSGKCE